MTCRTACRTPVEVIARNEATIYSVGSGCVDAAAFLNVFWPAQHHRDFYLCMCTPVVGMAFSPLLVFLVLDGCLFCVSFCLRLMDSPFLECCGIWLSPNRDELVTLFFEEPFMQAIQTNCPWLLRYLVTAIILTKVSRFIMPPRGLSIVFFAVCGLAAPSRDSFGIPWF